MKPSEVVKAAGVKSLLEFAELTGESEQTLINWSKNYPRRFELLLKGVIAESQQKRTEELTAHLRS